MARLGIIFLFMNMDTQDHTIYRVWIHLFFQPPMPEERRKTIWYELVLNPDPLVSQATALTTRPCLLGQALKLVTFKKCAATVLLDRHNK